MVTVRKLFYVSRATAPCDDPAIVKMLELARRNNLRLKITGCLLFSGRHFGQVVEGGVDTVASLVLKIAGDSRHTGIRILSDRFDTERDYADWSMGYLHDDAFEDVLGAMLTDRMPQTEAVDHVMGRMRLAPMMDAV